MSAEINAKVRKLQEKFGTFPKTVERTDRKIAKAFLLDGNFFWNGELYEPQAKHLGLGVYDLTVKPAI